MMKSQGGRFQFTQLISIKLDKQYRYEFISNVCQRFRVNFYQGCFLRCKRSYIYYHHRECGVRLPAVVTLHGGVPISQGSHVPLVRGSWFLPPSPIHIIGQWLQWLWLLTWRKICGAPHEISTQMRKQTKQTTHTSKWFSSLSGCKAFPTLTHGQARPPISNCGGQLSGLYGGQLWGYVPQSQSLWEAAMWCHATWGSANSTLGAIKPAHCTLQIHTVTVSLWNLLH